MQRETKRWLFLAMAVFLAAVLFELVFSPMEWVDNIAITKNPVLVEGTVYKLSRPKSAVYIDYSYCYGGHRYTRYGEKLKITRDLMEEYQAGTRKLWVVIAAADPVLSKVMESDEMFKKYNVNVADTVHIDARRDCN